MEPKSWNPQKTSTVAFLVFQHKAQRKERHLTENDNGGDGGEKLWQCRCRPDWFRWNGTLPDPACSVSNTACSLLLALLLAVSNAACSVFFATCSSCCWCPGSVSPPFLPFPLFWFDWARVQVLGKWIPIIPSMLFAGHTRLEIVMSLDTDVCTAVYCS